MSRRRLYEKRNLTDIIHNTRYNFMINFGYRDIREYGIGISYYNIKQGGNTVLAQVKLEPATKSGIKPVLWIGFNW